MLFLKAAESVFQNTKCTLCIEPNLKILFCFVDTPGHGSGWAETPRTDRGGDSIGETPTPGASKRKSRWDETPASQMGGSTPVLTPGKTPIGTPAMNMATPTPGMFNSLSAPFSWNLYLFYFL